MNFVFAALAAFYCLALGAFALAQRPRSRVAVLFAAYNFSNAAWNSGELFLLTARPHQWEWVLSFTGLGGCLLTAFVLHFLFIIAELDQVARFRRLIKGFYLWAAVLAVLHVTGLLNSAALPERAQWGGRWSSGGPLYFLLPIHMLAAMAILLATLHRARDAASGLRRKQLTYCLIAVLAGNVAIGMFFLSRLIDRNIYWIYFPFQALVSFIFGYAIFQYGLVPVAVAFKRLLLGVCLFLLTLFCTIGIASLYARHTGLLLVGNSPLWMLLAIVGVVTSSAPAMYSKIVTRWSLFQDVSAAHLTHELKSPLHSIQSANEILEIELAKERPDGRIVSDYLSLIQRNTLRLESIVRGVLNVAIAQSSDHSKMSRINVAELFRDVASSFPDHCSRISLSFVGEIHTVGDVEGLRQVAQNLISNAVRYAPTGPIEVQLRDLGGSVEISVTDHGIGIPKGKTQEMFKPFSRLHSGLTGKSTGLGLTIAKNWVEAHGGRIWAESEGEGKGTTVTFTLPAAS